MDQVRIGRFIAEERKGKGWTQKQLAEKLGISDKTVSKWECGNGFPEASLLLPLCGELGITVNDLLSGERVSGENYQEKAEDNMMEMISEREANRRQFILCLLLGGVSVLAFVTLIYVGWEYREVLAPQVRTVMTAVACAIFTVGIVAVLFAQQKIGYYRCAKCGKTFVPKFWAHTIGFNAVNRRLLKCPCCKNSCRRFPFRTTAKSKASGWKAGPSRSLSRMTSRAMTRSSTGNRTRNPWSCGFTWTASRRTARSCSGYGGGSPSGETGITGSSVLRSFPG